MTRVYSKGVCKRGSGLVFWVRFVSVLLLLVIGQCAAASNPVDIYLLMGQSNMAGRDLRGIDTAIDDPEILVFTADDQWQIARDPLHPQTNAMLPGVGPGMAFARVMKTIKPSTTVGLVPLAVGGSPLHRWQPGGDLYQNAVKVARHAMSHGTLRGILWHQGETDSRDLENAKTYPLRLAEVIRQLRTDLGAEQLPVVLGELGFFISTEKYPYVDQVRKGLHDVAEQDSEIAIASAEGLGHMGDDLHFFSAAAHQLGERYAKAMIQLQHPRWPSIARFPDNRRAAISLTFDDGLRQQFSVAAPMLDSLGFKGTFFVIPGLTPETQSAAIKNDQTGGGWAGIRSVGQS